ncbi:hypothetical protein B0H10DRAFT_1939383 [Mycena sp. CBHHK59/15]|nr:hypothetical protein B0H10DRAFT_1939383 [Mycena sp. CBHHK59/15]
MGAAASVVDALLAAIGAVVWAMVGAMGGDRISTDNRRSYREEVVFAPDSPLKRQRRAEHDRLQPHESAMPPPAPSSALDFSQPGVYQMGFDDENDADADDESTFGPVPRPKKKNFREAFDKSTSRACCAVRGAWARTKKFAACARRPNPQLDAKTASATICCARLASWIVTRRIRCIGSTRRESDDFMQIWDGKLFVKASLKKIGLRVQLGHRVREWCPEPHAVHEEFIVLHKNGIHDVAVDLCDCENAENAGALEIQMLRAGWFPRRTTNPGRALRWICWTIL